MKKLFLLLVGAFVFSASASNLPMSRQATLVEVYSSSEISLNVMGEGRNERAALGDLRKAAVWFALYVGTDPLLNNPEAIARFQLHQESFFELSNVNKFITFEATRSISSTQVVLPDRRRGFRIVRNVRVNVAALRAELERMGIVSTREALEK